MNADDLKRPCSGCDRWLPLDEDHFYRAGKKQDGTQIWSSKCKTCRAYDKAKETPGRHANESPEAEAYRKARLRCRQRARIKIAQKYQREYDRIYVQEMEKEGFFPDADFRGRANKRKAGKPVPPIMITGNGSGLFTDVSPDDQGHTNDGNSHSRRTA